MGAWRASTVAVATVIGCVLLVTVLVTWASSVGPSGVLEGDGPTVHSVPLPTRPSDTDSSSSTASPSPGDADAPRGGDPTLLRALVAVFEAAVALLVLAGLVQLARGLGERVGELRRRPPPLPEVEFDVIETPSRLAEAITRDAEDQRAALLDGTPRNAIVACWHRFEQQAAAAGVVRSEWETSAEFTLRVLDMVDAGSADVARLGGLYREARFSDHPMGEETRAAALAALDAIHARLPARSGAGP
ncbi:DUF4129 domain-containing protein [Nocardioides sp. MAHUQ-72]|uniref:DUF4129 domain-containing protein n=1 Tax=unclassified Nocardioides TaxID=2615069 RepID=UPI0036125F89